MIRRLIDGSFRAPLLALLLVLASSAIGAVWLQDLRRDVFPDLSAPIFNVITQNASMGAEELETAIAIPMEVALAGLPDVRRVRSVSQLGVAQVTIEFLPDADYYRSRQFVAERVAQVSGQLPPGTEPPLISSLTGRLNEIFEFTLEAEPGTADLMTLRDLAEFEVNNRLVAVPGCACGRSRTWHRRLARDGRCGPWRRPGPTERRGRSAGGTGRASRHRAPAQG